MYSWYAAAAPTENRTNLLTSRADLDDAVGTEVVGDGRVAVSVAGVGGVDVEIEVSVCAIGNGGGCTSSVDT